MSHPDLRTKLKALVGELHQQAALYRRGQELSDERQALAYTQVARRLAALLAESEGEPSFRDITATRCPRHATIPPTIMQPAEQECGVCMREEGILVGRVEQHPERAWLIESRFTPAPSWWTGTGWSRDSLDAVRFSRRRDAEASVAALPDFHTCFVTEHQWGFGAKSEPERNKLPFLCSCHAGSVCVEACKRGDHHSGCSWSGWRSLLVPARIERPGCGRDHGGGSWNANCPDCEAKAKLLGHPYIPCEADLDCDSDHEPDLCHHHGCGQPRSAHEVKP